MLQEHETQRLTDDRPVYEVPRALRLGDQHTGTGGVICNNGSGDANECSVGGGAINYCWTTGNTAGTCELPGNSPG